MGYDVRIERLGPSAVIDLQGSRQALAGWVKGALPPFPEKPNSASAINGLSLYWIAPERWLLRAALEHEDRLLQMTQPAAAPADISVVLVSDTLKFFRITGADAGEIVSSACSMDHHASVFPCNGASYTSVFGIKGLLIRIDDGFEIGVESSYADMIADYLARAAG